MPEDEKSSEMADIPALNWERQPSSELPPESTKHSENIVSRKRKQPVTQEQQMRRQMLQDFKNGGGIAQMAAMI